MPTCIECANKRLDQDTGEITCEFAGICKNFCCFVNSERDIKGTADILKASAFEVASWLKKTCSFSIPPDAISNDKEAVNTLMTNLANTYAFLSPILIDLRAIHREYKHAGASRDLIDGIADKRDAVHEQMETIKLQLNEVSRTITVYQIMQNELNMSNKM